MMDRIKKNINELPLSILNRIISQEMCVGCGVCTAQQGLKNKIEMEWDGNGFLVPNLVNITEITANSLAVCPFNPTPDRDVRTENELSDLFLGDAPKHYNKIGRYRNLYVGYSKEYRLTSSSGGLATYLTYQLLKQKKADYVFSVIESDNDGMPYEYGILSREDQILQASKTKYFPVTMAEVLQQLEGLDGKVAIVGIPCFIKALRLHQHYNPSIKEKITFLIGIICGGMKSKYFVEYLASKSGVGSSFFLRPEFRVKDYNSHALDYSFTCEDEQSNIHSLKMSAVGDMWGTGYFKNNACDFCDDVAAELADITLGDAWIDPYKQDGKGTNVIVTRSSLAEELIQQGMLSNELSLEVLDELRFIESQQGGYNHRHRGLGTRISHVRSSMSIPPKRYDKENISFDFKWVQKMRMKVRRKSIEMWKNDRSADSFDFAMQPMLKRMHFITKIYHRVSRFKRSFNKK